MPTPVFPPAAAARRTVRNAAAITVSRLLSNGAIFIWQILLARLLGVSEFGIYGAVGGLFTISVSLAGFGMSLIVIREVARNPDNAGRYASAALSIATVFTTLAFIGMNGAAWAGGFSMEVRALAAIASLSLFTDTLGSLAYDQLLAHERMVTTSTVEVVHLFVRIGLALGALALGGGLISVYAVTVVTGAGRAALLWAAVRRAGVRPHFPVDAVVRRRLWIGSLPLVISAVINITYTRIDGLLSLRLLTQTDTGNLNAAFVIVFGVVEILSTTVIVALYPLMARTAVDAAGDAMFYFIVRSLAWFTLIIGLPVGLIFTGYGRVITSIFGPNFAPAGDILRVLIWYTVVTMLVNVFSQAMFARDQQRRFVVFRAGGLALKLTLSVVLLPLFGILGAALTSVIAETMVLALASRGYFDASLLPRLVRLGAAVLLAALALGLGGLLHPVVGMGAGLLAYAGGLLLLRVLSPAEWDLLYRVAAALPGGAWVQRVWRRDLARVTPL